MRLRRSRCVRAAVEDPRFEEFVREHAGSLCGLARRLTADPHRAEDVVQEVLVRCAWRWETIRDLDNPLAYLRRAVVNEVISMSRRGWARELPRIELTDDGRPEPDFEHGVVVRDELRTALATLAPVQRAVIVLRYYEDLPDDEIATLLRCPASTVRSHARRALTRLRTSVAPLEATGDRHA